MRRKLDGRANFFVLVTICVAGELHLPVMLTLRFVFLVGVSHNEARCSLDVD